MTRLIVNDLDYVWQVLDGADIPFDMDGSNRLMVSDDYIDEARKILEENDVIFDEV